MANFKKTSRYSSAILSKNRSGKNFIILRNQIKLVSSEGDTFLTITKEIQQRPDLVSHIAYGDSSYWWIIYEFNGIKDPFFSLKLNDILRIPTKENVLLAMSQLEG